MARWIMSPQRGCPQYEDGAPDTFLRIQLLPRLRRERWPNDGTEATLCRQALSLRPLSQVPPSPTSSVIIVTAILFGVFALPSRYYKEAVSPYYQVRHRQAPEWRHRFHPRFVSFIPYLTLAKTNVRLSESSRCMPASKW